MPSCRPWFCLVGSNTSFSDFFLIQVLAKIQTLFNIKNLQQSFKNIFLFIHIIKTKTNFCLFSHQFHCVEQKTRKNQLRAKYISPSGKRLSVNSFLLCALKRISSRPQVIASKQYVKYVYNHCRNWNDRDWFYNQTILHKGVQERVSRMPNLSKLIPHFKTQTVFTQVRVDKTAKGSAATQCRYLLIV